MRPALPMTLMLLLLSSCGEDDARPDPCTAQIDTIAAQLARAAEGADPEDAPPDVGLPTMARGGSVPPGGLLLLVVGASEVRFDGRGVGGLDPLDQTAVTLARDLRVAAGLRASRPPFEVGLWAEPEVPVDTLVRLLAHAPPGVRFVLLGRGPLLDGPAPPPWLRTELTREVPPDEDEGVLPAVSAISPELRRRRAAAAAWERATDGCPDARAALPRTVDRHPVLLPPPSVDALLAAIRECGCVGVDVDAMGALAFEALRGGDGPLVRAAPALRFGAATGPGDELTLPVDATLEALAAHLAERPARPEPLWVRVDG